MHRWLRLELVLLALASLFACAGPVDSSALSIAPGDGDVHIDARTTKYTLTTGSTTASGFDFINGVYTGNAAGDVYYANGAFYADIGTQRGVVLAGPCSSPTGVRIPTSGYSRGPVRAVAGDSFVVLSRGDVRLFGVLLVTAAHPGSVTFQYSVVKTDDYGTTLTSGDDYTAGYDFLAQAYHGASDGDLYYFQGAFWANNYDERGVASLGACATVDSVTSIPQLTFNRFNTTATVGNCYVSPLHSNNRFYAVFRVDSQTSTTVTLTWHLVPVPVSQLAWQHCDRWHNPQAVAPTTSASTLTDFLATFPQITNAMNWISTLVPGYPAVMLPYDQWPAAMKTALTDNFVAYWTWYAGGMTGSDPTPVSDPPANLLPTDASNRRTAISEADAQALYVKYLALTFVVELQHQVPWSILEYDDASLAELFDARKFFNQWDGIGYELLDRSVIPAPPLMAASFVAQHDFLCNNRRKTIAEAVFWTRNLKHFAGEGTDAAAQIAYWQYPGITPASRELSGTHYNGVNDWVNTNLTQWTYGCHGTTGLLKSLLRTLNIPVEDFDFDNKTISSPDNSLTVSGGHAVPHFTSEHLMMSHADDTYQNTFWGTEIMPFPIDAFLIDDATFFAWYPNGGSMKYAAGHQMDVIWATYGTKMMLEDRYADLTSAPVTDTHICSEFVLNPQQGQDLTCTDAENMGLLDTLDPLVSPYLATGLSALQSDESKLPHYYNPEVQFLPAPCDQTCISNVCAQYSTCCNAWSDACSQVALTSCGSLCDYP